MIDNANIETFSSNNSLPLSSLDTMDALLSIRCYNCRNKGTPLSLSSTPSITDMTASYTPNDEPIIIRKTGRKIFRIETRCAQCKNIKTKKFCDTYN